ncbi:hypothetical protein [Thiofaba sp. EF100]|uniref:hypothetical protein n=1 Tax=Thiofaba sp. EF100 TaxID=3121274 RepID=UPI0032221985
MQFNPLESGELLKRRGGTIKRVNDKIDRSAQGAFESELELCALEERGHGGGFEQEVDIPTVPLVVKL